MINLRYSPELTTAITMANAVLERFTLSPEEAAELIDKLAELQKHEYKLGYDRRIERKKEMEKLNEGER